MADQEDRLSDTTPLGRSVEDVEADSQNAVNPRTGGEQQRSGPAVAPLVVPGSNPAGSPGGGVMVNGVLPVAGVAGEAAGLQAQERQGAANDQRGDRDLDDTPQ